MIKNLLKFFSFKKVNSSFACPICNTKVKIKHAAPLTQHECPSCNSKIVTPYRIEDYTLDLILGSGGEGDVYRTHKASSPGTLFATKLLHRETRINKKESLIREAKILDLFEAHKHILTVIEYGYHHQQAYIISEHVDGLNLENYITQNKPCEEECLMLIFQLIKAEKSIIQQGYLYRDLKPDNILIDSTGKLTLVDFGLCSSADDYVEIEEEYIAGTAQYLPPERLLGEVEEERSEIYSLGLIIYFMLKGRHLIQDVSKQRMAAKHLEEKNSEWIQQGLRTSSPVLVDILIKMTSFRKDERYRTITEVEAQLKRYFNESYRNINHKTHC